MLSDMTPSTPLSPRPCPLPSPRLDPCTLALPRRSLSLSRSRSRSIPILDDPCTDPDPDPDPDDERDGSNGLVTRLARVSVGLALTLLPVLELAPDESGGSDPRLGGDARTTLDGRRMTMSPSECAEKMASTTSSLAASRAARRSVARALAGACCECECARLRSLRLDWFCRREDECGWARLPCSLCYRRSMPGPYTEI